MTMPTIHRILATTVLCLAAGACVAYAYTRRAEKTATTPTSHLMVSATKQGLSEQAETVWFAFTQFPENWLLEKLVTPGDDEVAKDELIAKVQKKIENIRPCCEMLRTLPPERVKELILLADAVLWQSQWLSNVYMGEFGVECEYPFDVGLLDLSHSARLAKQVLSGEKKVSPRECEVLKELVELAGGEQVLDYPAAMYDDQRSKDYKTALQFYKDFCTAASTEDDAQAIAKLKELEPVMTYFAAKGEGEIWRINKLAHFFLATLLDLREHGITPYPEPLLSKKHCTPTREKALQPFMDTFPALKNLLYL